jgi:hypothetical protein
MPTARQIAAIRLNSQKATGPRTIRGMAASRFNSQKHGIFATPRIVFDETAAFRPRARHQRPASAFLVPDLH